MVCIMDMKKQKIYGRLKMHRITYHVTELTADEMILASGRPHKINPKFCSKQDMRLFYRLKEISKLEKIL